MNSPIEPCPYFGSKVASVGYACDRSYYFVSCSSGCGMDDPKGRNEELAICAWNRLAERARGGRGEKEVVTSSIASSLLSIANSLKKLAETEEYETPPPPPPSQVPHWGEKLPYKREEEYGKYRDV